MKKQTRNKFIYEEIAENLSAQILKGAFKAGEALPPIRKISKDLGVSVSSIVQSYAVLESRGFIEAKSQSGFYVRELSNIVLAINIFHIIPAFH